MKRSDCSAVVLAGGQGKRMGGCSKAELILNGRRFLDRLEEQLEGFGELILSTNNSMLADGTKFRPVGDCVLGKGPLGGLCASLQVSRSVCSFVVACDMPYFSGRLADWMIGQYAGEGALICRTSDGRLHPLCGLYSRASLPNLQQSLQMDRLKISQILNGIDCRIVEVSEDMTGQPFFYNVNTREDLAHITGLSQ